MARSQQWRYVLLHGWTGIAYGLILLSGALLLFIQPLREALGAYWAAYPFLVFAFFAVAVPAAMRSHFGRPNQESHS